MATMLSQYDSDRQAIINPEDVIQKISGFPKIAVATFSPDILNPYQNHPDTEHIADFITSEDTIPIYRINYRGTPLAICLARAGAPTSVVQLEEIVAMGAQKVVMFGACGVLDSSIENADIIIPTAAFRDEGTSYHYLPPSDKIALNPKYIDAAREVFDSLGYTYRKGKTWTTDANYRETRRKMENRKPWAVLLWKWSVPPWPLRHNSVV